MIGVLIWLLAWAMAGESNAEQRRLESVGKVAKLAAADVSPIERAA